MTPDQESFRGHLLRWLKDKAAENSAGAITGWLTIALSLVWLKFPQLYQVLLAPLGPKWIMALVFVLIATNIYAFLGWRRQKRKGVSFFDRLVPIPGAGCSVDPKNGEVVCPHCVDRFRPSYMQNKGGGKFYCHVCGIPIEGVTLPKSSP